MHQKKGLVAERLGTGLQNRLQRFESARDLCVSPGICRGLFFSTMLIGEDFEKIHITVFGLDISEPNVFLSDLVMALISLYCGWRLFKGTGNSSFKKWWMGFFFLFGISSLAGGFGHALYSYFGHLGKLFTWVTGIVSIYMIERGMIEAYANSPIKTRLKLFSMIKLVLLYLVFFGILFFGPIDQKPNLPFLPIAINTIIGVSWFAGVYAFKLSKSLHKDFKFIFTGVLIMLPSAFFFLGKINLHPWMDKNDVSHVLLTAGIVYFMIGVEKLSNGSALTNLNAK